jgi:hypothetical protein
MRYVTGIFVGSEGLFSRRARLIPGDHVSVLGIDSVLTLESDVITDDSEFVPSQRWLRRDSVQGRIMNTAGGTKVGMVGDLLIDDYKVVAFSLARVNVEGPIARNRIVARTAVTDAGGFDGSIIVDLSEAEQPVMGVDSIIVPVNIESDMQPDQSSETADLDAEDEASS